MGEEVAQVPRELQLSELAGNPAEKVVTPESIEAFRFISTEAAARLTGKLIKNPDDSNRSKYLEASENLSVPNEVFDLARETFDLFDYVRQETGDFPISIGEIARGENYLKGQLPDDANAEIIRYVKGLLPLLLTLEQGHNMLTPGNPKYIKDKVLRINFERKVLGIGKALKDKVKEEGGEESELYKSFVDEESERAGRLLTKQDLEKLFGLGKNAPNPLQAINLAEYFAQPLKQSLAIYNSVINDEAIANFQDTQLATPDQIQEIEDADPTLKTQDGAPVIHDNSGETKSNSTDNRPLDIQIEDSVIEANNLLDKVEALISKSDGIAVEIVKRLGLDGSDQLITLIDDTREKANSPSNIFDGLNEYGLLRDFAKNVIGWSPIDDEVRLPGENTVVRRYQARTGTLALSLSLNSRIIRSEYDRLNSNNEDGSPTPAAIKTADVMLNAWRSYKSTLGEQVAKGENEMDINAIRQRYELDIKGLGDLFEIKAYDDTHDLISKIEARVKELIGKVELQPESQFSKLLAVAEEVLKETPQQSITETPEQTVEPKPKTKRQLMDEWLVAHGIKLDSLHHLTVDGTVEQYIIGRKPDGEEAIKNIEAEVANQQQAEQAEIAAQPILEPTDTDDVDSSLLSLALASDNMHEYTSGIKAPSRPTRRIQPESV